MRTDVCEHAWRCYRHLVLANVLCSIGPRMPSETAVKDWASRSGAGPSGVSLGLRTAMEFNVRWPASGGPNCGSTAHPVTARVGRGLLNRTSIVVWRGTASQMTPYNELRGLPRVWLRRPKPMERGLEIANGRLRRMGNRLLSREPIPLTPGDCQSAPSTLHRAGPARARCP